MEEARTGVDERRDTDHEVGAKKKHTLADVAILLGPTRGPDCMWCNAPTKRTGACFTCVACGSTTAC